MGWGPSRSTTERGGLRTNRRHHPCTKWVRSSIRNYEWLIALTDALNDEYRYRYDRKTNHKSFEVIKKLPLPDLPDNGLTRWARAMPLECKVGDNVISSRDKLPVKNGNAMPLAFIPDGMLVHNIEFKIGKGGQMVRSAGGYARIMAKESGKVTLRLPSGEVRMVDERCLATIGSVGNRKHETIVIGKAGRKRWMGRRPKVRGVAMNPVDHPMGGGEGRTSGGGHPVSPWGTPSKGFRTRKKNKTSNKFIVKRRK